MQKQIKGFKIKYHPKHVESLAEYLVIPITPKLHDEIITNLTKLPFDKDPLYFDINNIHYDYTEQKLIPLTDKFYVNLCKFFNFNIDETYHINELIRQYYLYQEDYEKVLKELKQGIDYEIIVMDDDIKYQNISNYYQKYTKFKEAFLQYLQDNNPEEGEEGHRTEEEMLQEISQRTKKSWGEQEDGLYLIASDYYQEEIDDDLRYQLIKELEENYTNNNFGIYITYNQLSKLLSQESDLYLFFGNSKIVHYDGFSVKQEQYKKDRIDTFVNKFLFLNIEKSVWEEYKDNIKVLSSKQIDNEIDIKTKLENITAFTLQSDTPIYFIKGSQPSIMYENYKISPFIKEKNDVLLRRKIVHTIRDFDLGSQFNIFKKSSFNHIKGIIPNTLQLYVQNSKQDIDFYTYFKSYRQYKEDTRYQYNLIYDQPLDQFTIEEIVELIYDQQSEEQQIIFENKGYSIEDINFIIHSFENIRLQLNEYGIFSSQNKPDNIDSILSYLDNIGFDMDSNNLNYYGLLKTFTPNDNLKMDKIIGLVQYTTPQLLLVYPSEQNYYGQYHRNFQLNQLNDFNNVYLFFHYYFYVDNISEDIQENDIYKYRQMLSDEANEIFSDQEIEDIIYREYLEYYYINENETDFISFPFIQKIQNTQEKNKPIEDVTIKFQLYEMQLSDFGNVLTKRVIVKDLDYGIKYVRGIIPSILPLQKYIYQYTPMEYYYFRKPIVPYEALFNRAPVNRTPFNR